MIGTDVPFTLLLVPAATVRTLLDAMRQIADLAAIRIKRADQRARMRHISIISSLVLLTEQLAKYQSDVLPNWCGYRV
jgi:hypothetical protein